jgi:hypothetical protein
MAPALAARPLAAPAGHSRRFQSGNAPRRCARARRVRIAPAAALDLMSAAVSAGGMGVGQAWGAEAGAGVPAFGLPTETLSYGLAALVSLGAPLAFASARQNRCGVAAKAKACSNNRRLTRTLYASTASKR